MKPTDLWLSHPGKNRRLRHEQERGEPSGRRVHNDGDAHGAVRLVPAREPPPPALLLQVGRVDVRGERVGSADAVRRAAVARPEQRRAAAARGGGGAAAAGDSVPVLAAGVGAAARVLAAGRGREALVPGDSRASGGARAGGDAGQGAVGPAGQHWVIDWSLFVSFLITIGIFFLLCTLHRASSEMKSAAWWFNLKKS